MIFYFTGTGNSLAAAQKLKATDEKLVSMAAALKNQEFDYKVENGEKVGFVFPVYFYSLPSIVIDFIEKLHIENAEYVYSVITCGGGIFQAGAILKRKLAKRNIKLDYCTELVMPDNYILMYENQALGWEECLTVAYEKLKEIAEDIASKKCRKIGKISLGSDITAIMYKHARKTAKFHAESTCISCGKCEKNCPGGAIKMVNGKPSWVKDKCAQCLSCINRCPVKAIQYGERTKTQGRYVHPDL